MYTDNAIIFVIQVSLSFFFPFFYYKFSFENEALQNVDSQLTLLWNGISGVKYKAQKMSAFSVSTIIWWDFGTTEVFIMYFPDMHN